MLESVKEFTPGIPPVEVSNPVEMPYSGSPEYAQLQFVSSNVSKWLTSETLASMFEGQRYFDNENDIFKRQMKVIGKDGVLQVAEYLANNKLSHAFLRKLTKQKIGYLLSKPFTVKSNSEDFQTLLANYINSSFYRLLRNTGEEAVIGGISWIQPYYTEDGILSFKHIPGTQIIPFWKDADHTQLERAIRIYEVDIYEGATKRTERHIKLYTPEAVYNYIDVGGLLLVNPTTPVEYNFVLKTDLPLEGTGIISVPLDAEDVATEHAYSVMWNRIPLIPVKYNSKEKPLLKFIKPLIDDYDSRTSDMANVLEDEPNRIKVVRNYDGTSKDDFIYNLAKYRTVFLRDNGEISTLESNISVEALEKHLVRLRKDIFEFGGGVDTQNQDLAAASGSSLKFVYADLDMDCAEFAIELSWALEEISWFIKQDLTLKGFGQFNDASFGVEFNTDIAINETETVENLFKSVGMISTRTILEQHPYVTDAIEEEARMKIDQAEQLVQLKKEVDITAAATATQTPANV